MLSLGLIFSLAWAATSGVTIDFYGKMAIGVFAVGAAVGVLLRTRPGLSLSRLRALELLIFSSGYVQWAAVHAFLYPTIRLENPPIWFAFILGYAMALPWVIMIVAYGILIPNTARRCAAVVSVMAVTPVVITTLNGLDFK